MISARCDHAHAAAQLPRRGPHRLGDGGGRRLVVTQPSVSAAVTALAREVGHAAARARRPRRAADRRGRRFAPYAADVIGLLEKGRQAAREAAAAERARCCASPR